MRAPLLLASLLAACAAPVPRSAGAPVPVVATIDDALRLDFVVKSKIYPEAPDQLVLTARRSGVSLWDVAGPPRPVAHWAEERDVEGQDRVGDLLVVVARRGALLTFEIAGDRLRHRATLPLVTRPTPGEAFIGDGLRLAGGGPFTALHVALRAAGGRTHAFVSAPVSGELLAVDVTDPDHPRQVGAVDTGIELIEGVGLHGHHVLTAGFGSDGRLRVVDVADPAALRVVGGLDAPAWRQLIAARDAAHPDLLFTAGWDDPGGLVVFDVRDPARPRVHGQLLLPALAQANRVALADGQAWLPLERSPGGLAGVDIRDPARPRLLSLALGLPGVDKPYTLAAHGDFLYLFGSRAPKMVVLKRPPGRPP